MKKVKIIYLALFLTARALGQSNQQVTNTYPPPVNFTAEQDHQNMMDQLHITSLRPGANGNDPKAVNAANYDEAKANP